jgi:outer membrane protein OmpA-like peptidoglycan-associated protein
MAFTLRIIITTFLLLSIALIFKTCGGSHEEVHATVAQEHEGFATHDAETKTKPAPKARVSLKVVLPNGVTLDAYKGGIEDRLVSFLKTDWKKLGEDSLKNTWFDFDNLNFEMSSATITPESEVQIKNIAAILNAFPNAKFKIGGYTDKTGDAATNKKLSQERADSVLTAIGAAGAKPEQLIKAEGYGSEHATIPADASDEERQVDRRISISVRA